MTTESAIKVKVPFSLATTLKNFFSSLSSSSSSKTSPQKVYTVTPQEEKPIEQDQYPKAAGMILQTCIDNDLKSFQLLCKNATILRTEINPHLQQIIDVAVTAKAGRILKEIFKNPKFIKDNVSDGLLAEAAIEIDSVEELKQIIAKFDYDEEELAVIISTLSENNHPRILYDLIEKTLSSDLPTELLDVLLPKLSNLLTPINSKMQNVVQIAAEACNPEALIYLRKHYVNTDEAIFEATTHEDTKGHDLSYYALYYSAHNPAMYEFLKSIFAVEAANIEVLCCSISSEASDYGSQKGLDHSRRASGDLEDEMFENF